MTNLIIGLCFGAAAALALLIMWRMADRLRDQVQSEENGGAKKNGAIGGMKPEGSARIEHP